MARLLQLVRELPQGTDWHWLSVPAPLADPEVFLAGAPDGPISLWVPPDDLAVAAIGATDVIVGEAEGRMEQVLTRGTRLLRGVLCAGEPSAPKPRCLGGFAFRGGGQSDSWQQFGDARFVLPRLMYFREGSRAHLVLVTSGDDREQSSWLDLAEDRLVALAAASVDPGPPPSAVDQVDVSRDRWRTLVEAATTTIASGRLEKVVAARSSTVTFDATLDPVDVLLRLSEGDNGCTRFAFRFGSAVFLGASPEKLIRRRGRVAETEALAGSIRTSGTESSRTLLASPKERSEHDLVVREITRLLAPLPGKLELPDGPEAETFRHIQHLRTPIRLTLDTPMHVLELAARLHPTPAVGGVPTGEALAWITEHEGLNRGWYAGPVGWFDRDGDGEFDVALRSGLLDGNAATLYAGGGVVRGSDPESEYAETSLKLAALRSALGLSQ